MPEWTLSALLLIHIVAAIVAVGSNLTYLFWLRRAGLDGDRLVFVINTVRALDRMVANPAYIVVLVSGLTMLASGEWGFGPFWVTAGLGLYAFVAILGLTTFAPAIRRQAAEAERDPSSPAYAAAAARSRTLGMITTSIVLVIVTLMVYKPTI